MSTFINIVYFKHSKSEFLIFLPKTPFRFWFEYQLFKQTATNQEPESRYSVSKGLPVGVTSGAYL